VVSIEIAKYVRYWEGALVKTLGSGAILHISDWRGV